MKTENIILTGITPSGKLTLGNYIGSIKQMLDLQEDPNNKLFMFIANLHAITVPGISENKEKKLNDDLKARTESVAALYLAAGINPLKTTIFIQSEVPAHCELSWIITTLSTMGQLERMTQFKDKAKSDQMKANNNTNFIPAGLFVYPSLMAADILLYDANQVPVGIDQKQHLEYTRDIAIRFNNLYEKIFVIPEPRILETTNKINALLEPTKKMSKSDKKIANSIFLLDDEQTIHSKIKAAITDSEFLIKYDEIKKPGVSNLISIYSALKNISINEAEQGLNQFNFTNYGQLKEEISKTICKILLPIQNEYYKIINDKKNKLFNILNSGAIKANQIATKKLTLVKETIGLY